MNEQKGDEKRSDAAFDKKADGEQPQALTRNDFLLRFGGSRGRHKA
jgi:hypothetical protein